MRPLVVIEGPAEAYRHAVSALRRSGWRVVAGFDSGGSASSERSVRAGEIGNAQEAAAALLAALDGAGLVLHATADRLVVDRLCDDLRHLGPVEHRLAGEPTHAAVLPAEHQALVGLLLSGFRLADAASELSISRRTADRRLADIRRFYRVDSTPAALRAARRDG